MQNLEFHDYQCVQINNEIEFDKVYPYLRSAQMGVTLDEWLTNINKGYPTFPIYLEHMQSVSVGWSIGFIYEPIGTITKYSYEIITLEQAML